MQLTTDELLDAIRERLGGASEGRLSIATLASELGAGRRSVTTMLGRLQAERRIRVLDSRRSAGTHVRIIDQDGGGEMIGTKQYRAPQDLRDSDPGGMLSGPVMTRRLTEEERRALGFEDRRPAPAQPVEVDDWETIVPERTTLRTMTARLTASRGVLLSAEASRQLLGERRGVVRLLVQRSKSRRHFRVRPDPDCQYQTTYTPPGQANARMGGARLLRRMVEMGAKPGRAYEVRFEDGWAIIDLTRPIREVKAS